MPPLTVHHSSPDFSVATWHSLLITVWSRIPEAQDLQQVRHTQGRLRQQVSHISGLTVLRKLGIPKGSLDEVRDESAKLQAEVGTYSRGNAIVMEADGLLATIARTFTAGVRLMARSTVPTQVFRTIPEGLTWLAGLPGQDSEVVASMDTLAKEMEQRFPR